MTNQVFEFQVISRDPEGTARFYSDLFGWNVDSANPMGYRQIGTGGDGVQGGIWPAPPQSPTFAQLFISVANVGEAVRKAEALGARVIIPPTVLPLGEEMAVLHDPQGMPFGICRKP